MFFARARAFVPYSSCGLFGRWHNGRPRTVPDLNPWFHSSVRIRMEEKGYLWAARLQDGATIRWADQDGIADGESVGEGEESFDEGSDRK